MMRLFAIGLRIAIASESSPDSAVLARPSLLHLCHSRSVYALSTLGVRVPDPR